MKKSQDKQIKIVLEAIELTTEMKDYADTYKLHEKFVSDKSVMNRLSHMKKLAEKLDNHLIKLLNETCAK